MKGRNNLTLIRAHNEPNNPLVQFVRELARRQARIDAKNDLRELSEKTTGRAQAVMTQEPFRPALISLKEICATLTVSRTAVNILRAAGDFPQPVELGERRIAFVRDEFDAWLQERIDARSRK